MKYADVARKMVKTAAATSRPIDRRTRRLAALLARLRNNGGSDNLTVRYRAYPEGGYALDSYSKVNGRKTPFDWAEKDLDELEAVLASRDPNMRLRGFDASLGADDRMNVSYRYAK